MRKILVLCAAVMACCMSATAQLQVQNAGFELWDNEGTDNIEPANWNSFKTASGDFNIMGGKQVEKSNDVRPGSTGTASVRIFARSILGTIAQGNLTTGRINMGSTDATDATGNYNYTQTNDDAFNQKFTGRPKAIRFWAKVSCKYGAAVSCILHTNGRYQDPEANEIAATVVAKASNTSITSNQEWQEVTVPFIYYADDNTAPAYVLISFMTSGQPGKGDKNDYMLIDDVEFLYDDDNPTPGPTPDPTPEPTPQPSAIINLPNGNFELWTASAGNFLQVGEGERTRPDSEPEQWSGSSVDLLGGLFTRSVVKVTTVSPIEEENNKSVRLTNTNGTYISTHTIPGFITLGQQWTYIDRYFTTFNQGVYGGIAYNKQPDAIQGRFRRPSGSNDNDKAHIIAYLWNGEFKSKIGDASKPDTEVADAAHAVLGKTESSGNGVLIASCDYAITASENDDWQTVIVPLEYAEAAQTVRPEKLNVILSAGDIWNINGVKADNRLDVDDITMIFYSELAVAEYQGSTLSFTNGSAQVDAPFESSSLYLRANGRDAAVETFYNDDTGLLTVTVKGGDIDTNPDNSHTYYIQFQEPSKVVYSQVFTDDLLVSINGTENPVRQTDVILSEMKDGSYTLRMENFYMGDDIEGKYYVGSIIIDNLPINADGSFSTARTIQIAAGTEPANAQWIGPLLGNVPIDMDGRVTADSLHTHIIIDLQGRMGQLIDVKFGKSLIEQSKPQEQEPEPDPTKPTIELSGKHTYTDALVVSINGTVADTQRTSIDVEFNDDNTLNLALYNFILPSGDDVMYVGNVELSGVPFNLKGGLPYATFNSTKVVKITEGTEPTDAIWLGPMLGEIPITLKGKVGTEKLNCTIDIMMGGVGAIHVTFGNDEGWPEVDPGVEPEEDPILRNYVYSGPLSVTVNGESNAPQTANVTLEPNDDGTVDLTLRNFYMELSSGERMPIGNIHLTGITPVEVANLDYYMFMTQQEIVIEPGDDANEMWIGPILQEIPITMSGKLARWKMFATISIYLADMGENVRVVFGEDFADDIRDLRSNTPASGTSNTAIYTLTGQKLQSVPKAGLYIINGRKVVVQ